MTLTASVFIMWLIRGRVIGGLARLLVPGRQHIGLLVTMLIGIVAALVGGFLTAAILGAGHTVITFIVALVAAAVLVSAAPRSVQRRSRGSRPRSRPRYRGRRAGWLHW